jgi:Right handed beta helix region
MNLKKFGLMMSGLFALLLASSAPVYAQATRTWVSGVGDDANPCSRTAPCKTFAGAISKTAAGGEINVLDPGGFGGVTITKSITISSEGFEAGVLVSGTNGIIINAGGTDVVVLRGLDIEGLGTGLNGIRFIAGGQLHVENCTINNFAQKGILFEPNSAAQLFVKNSTIRNNDTVGTGGGIQIKPTAGTTQALIDNVRLERNQFGLRVDDNASATVSHSVAAGNLGGGFTAVSASGPAVLNLTDSVSTSNASGVIANGANALIRLTNNVLTQNVAGINIVSSGVVSSFGNNKNRGNTTDGAPNGPALTPLQ